MNLLRVTSAILICASLTTLTACGKDAADTAGPAASSSATTSTPAAASPTTGGTGDKELCESAKKAGDEMKAAFVAALQSGKEPSAADLKKILTELDEKVTTLASAGGDSKVAAAMKRFGAEAAKAATAADPANAADNPDFEKAGAELSAACRTAGVDVVF